MTTGQNASTGPGSEERHALVVAPRRTSAMELWGSEDPEVMTGRMAAIANAMSKVVEAQGLYITMGTDRDGRARKYVLVEGWSLVGAMIGVFPRTVAVDAVEQGSIPAMAVEKQGRSGSYVKNYPAASGILTFRARVDLVTRDGVVVGGAEALCSKHEETWRDRDDNQIASMAQTRATAKAYRMSFGFVMPMSGYAATPAEEMDGIETSFADNEPRGQQARQQGQQSGRGNQQAQRGRGNQQSAQQGGERPQRAERKAPEPQAPEKITTVGQLLTWVKEQRAANGLPMDTRYVQDVLDVDSMEDIAKQYRDNWGPAVQILGERIAEEAKARREAAGGEAPPDPETDTADDVGDADAAVAALSDDQRSAYLDLVASGTSPEDALAAVQA